MSHLTLSAPSAGSSGFIFIFRGSTVFWGRVSSRESHLPRENMRTLAEETPYVLTAFIFLSFFFQKSLGRRAVSFDCRRMAIRTSRHQPAGNWGAKQSPAAGPGQGPHWLPQQGGPWTALGPALAEWLRVLTDHFYPPRSISRRADSLRHRAWPSVPCRSRTPALLASGLPQS